MVIQREISIGDYRISTDKALLDRNFIHEFLSTKSYWAQGIRKDIIELSINHALCIGSYHFNKQVGFARVVTDYATFGYLADVFVDESHRGRGLSKHLMDFIFNIPELSILRRIMLGTRDAHSLYSRYGFKPLAAPDRFMEIHRADIYKNLKPDHHL